MEAGIAAVWSQTQECWDSSLKLEEARNGFSPRTSQREGNPARFWPFSLQNFKRINLAVLSHPICGNLLQQPHKTNTQLGLRSPLTPSLNTIHPDVPLSKFPLLSPSCSDSRSNLLPKPSFPHLTLSYGHLCWFLLNSQDLYLEIPGLSPHYLHFSHGFKYSIYTLKTQKYSPSSQTSSTCSKLIYLTAYLTCQHAAQSQHFKLELPILPNLPDAFCPPL